MNKSIVILQPQYFPWIGVLEQVSLADIYVHYDDVQYTKGKSFLNRVQLKTPMGQQWITVPVAGSGLRNINQAKIDNTKSWKRKHCEFLKQTYAAAPYLKEMLHIVDDIFSHEYEILSELNINALEKVAAFFELKTEFIRSSELGISGSSTKRVVDICRHFGADKYITGLGARNYVDYNQFEEANIQLHYMDYKKQPYSQMHGDFIPYVSILDLIANCGREGKKYICSGTRYWKDIPDLDSL